MKNLLPTLLILSLASSATAGDLRVVFSDSDGNPIYDAVIEIVAPDIPIPQDWDYYGMMDQKDKEFMDNVVTVVAGSYVSFPNSDDIQHHVYSFSDAKNFELPLYSGNEAEPIHFDIPGVAVVGCNIHDWMLGYIYVSESHLVAKSNAEGVAEISNLEAGDYTFKVWHERARRRDQFATFDTTINASGATIVEIQIDLGRGRRIRRAPTGSGGDY